MAMVNGIELSGCTTPDVVAKLIGLAISAQQLADEQARLMLRMQDLAERARRLAHDQGASA